MAINIICDAIEMINRPQRRVITPTTDGFLMIRENACVVVAYKQAATMHEIAAVTPITLMILSRF